MPRRRPDSRGAFPRKCSREGLLAAASCQAMTIRVFQASRQGHGDPDVAVEVSRENLPENLPEFRVIGFRIEPFLRASHSLGWK